MGLWLLHLSLLGGTKRRPFSLVNYSEMDKYGCSVLVMYTTEGSLCSLLQIKASCKPAHSQTESYNDYWARGETEPSLAPAAGKDVMRYSLNGRIRKNNQDILK